MKVVAKNRRARFDYDILETIEAGIVLTGPEVKSCRSGNVNLLGSYVSLVGGNLVLKNASVSPYPYTRNSGYEPTRERCLLVKRKEEDHLRRCLEERGVTVIPLDVHAGRFIKVLLGIARGRKKYDKRQHIRERDVKRQLKRRVELP